MMLGAMLLTAQASAADGVKVDHLGVNNTLVRITGDGKYLMLPVQESNDDDRIDVLVDGKKDGLSMSDWPKAKSIILSPLILLPIRIAT